MQSGSTPARVFSSMRCCSNGRLCCLGNTSPAGSQAAGYAGFLLFVLRVPADRSDRRWRPVERALPLVALALASLQLLSMAYLFGYRTATVTRATLLSGYAVDAAALIILLARRRPTAARLSAPPLGDLGMFDRPTRFHPRRAPAGHDPIAGRPGRFHATGRGAWPVLSAQQHSLLSCLRSRSP